MPSDADQTPQGGKRKKLVVPDSDDSDDSDESVVQSRRRKKIFRVLSEGESSDEDSDVQRPVVRRQNYRVISEDESSYESSGSEVDKPGQFGESTDSSEWQSDWSSSDEMEPEKKTPAKRKFHGKTKKKVPQIMDPTDVESDNSDEQLEKCPICLLPFKKQQLATPSSCEHCFCLECLIEWSKNINTCPVDRQTFGVIHVRNELGGKIVKHVPVEVVPRIEDQVQEDPTFCEVCHQCDREDRMLLCDGCDCGYHLECLTPPMNEVPMEEWFCPECSQNSQDDAEAVEIDLDEISDLMEEARRLGVSYGRTRTGLPNETHTRIIPRTRHTERVRATIRRRARICENPQPSERPLGFDPNQPSTSSGLESFGDNSRSRSPSNASTSVRARNTSRKSGGRTTRRKVRKRSRTTKNSGTLYREVRITEINEDGEREEIVTYVKVAPTTSRRRKRTKRTRKVYA